MQTTRFEAEVLHPSALSASDVASWRAIAASEPAFASPLLGPDFAAAVGAVRDDARVAVFRRAGEALGFMGYHARPGGLARPIGAPLSDYHALVSVADPGFSGPEALAAAGVSAFRFSGLLDPHRLFDPARTAARSAYVIGLETTADAYLETLRQENPKRFKNFRRLDHKLEREVGPILLKAPDRSRDTFDALIAWKRDQFARTGGHDVLRPAWTRELLERLFVGREGPLQPLMVGLYAGEQLVAGHFGVRLGGVYHPWIASTNSALAACSPGQVFLYRAISAMPDLDLVRYDLGPGHDHYKRPFCLTETLIAEGLATAQTTGGRLALLSEDAWALAGAQRLRRRLDAIAAVELSTTGRIRGVVDAFTAGLNRRSPQTEAAA